MKHRALIGWAPLLALFATACGGNDRERYPMTVYDPKSDFAQTLLDLQNLTLYLGVGVGLLVFGLMAYISLRFRHRPDQPDPDQVHGNTRLELAWTLFPAVILAIIAVPTVQTIFETQRQPPPNALTIDVVGWQWWFEFKYPINGGQDTVITANEVHIPAGQPIHFRMTGGDVIHNFWVPQMGGKRYLIPNHFNSIQFTTNEPGVYLGQCAEFCGPSHALMKMRLIVHTPEGYARWIRNEARPAVEPMDSAILIGQQKVTQGACAGCHIIKGTQMVGRSGPDLTHFAQRRTLAAGILENNAHNLAAWLRNPPAIKPGSRMPNLGLSEQDLGYIVAYLQTLE